MLNSLKRLMKLSINSKQVELGRWAIKHEIDKCNKYMINMHADPGYISPFKKKIEKNINFKSEK